MPLRGLSKRRKACSMYQVQRVNIGKTAQLDELAREYGRLYS